MKTTIHYIICVLAVALISTPSWAQQIMEGTAEVKNLSVSRDNGRVTVKMDIDVTTLEVGADETLVLTPAIEKGGESLDLPSVEIMGRRAWLYYLRNGEQSVTNNPLYAEREAKRAERKAGAQLIAYSTQVPYEAWMKSANVVIKEGSCGCDPELLALGESPLQRILHDPYKPQYRLTLLTPEPEPIKVRAESLSAYINFKVDKYEILEDYKNNATELASVISSIDKVKDDADLTITSISIEGWASPEAPEDYNERLSQNRANSLADYVAAKTGIERSRITATGRGEDWINFKREVENMPMLLDQKKVLAIIDDNSMTLDQKDKQLSELIPPTIYERLMGEVYPKLRRNDYRIEYNVRNFNIDEARRIIKSDPRKLSLDEMYRVAGSYRKGSDEYKETLAIAARTYPTVVAAAVDMAAVQIADGEWDAALQTLAKSDAGNANIQVAKGYAYAGKGDVEKARAEWEKAAAQGSADAKHNLAELAKSLE
ncbi:MAG: DUF3868 domain-containing protein [Alistipes sp.]|nr:DUF3868 domain-containing protein [Alistipes sp.]